MPPERSLCRAGATLANKHRPRNAGRTSSSRARRMRTARRACEERHRQTFYIHVMHAGGELRADSNLVSNRTSAMSGLSPMSASTSALP
jgi:hypothetical protein